MGRDIWDFATINNEIPIEDVLAYHGIYPERGKYRIREDDDHASASVHPQKKYGNIVHDFGFGNNFNPLTLTMYLQGVDMVEASRILGEAFRIPPKISGKGNEEDANRISDYDWKTIGIYPDMASKNIDFDLERYGIQNSMKMSLRYQMPMSELRELAVDKRNAPDADDKDFRRYEAILRLRAVPFVQELRYEYYRRMNDDFSIAKVVNENVDLEMIYRIHSEEYDKLAEKLSQAEFILKKAIEGTSVKFTGHTYNPERDFMKVVRGEVSFEIGLNSHFEVSNAAYRERAKVFYCVVSMNEYYNLLENGLDIVMAAARQKGDTVTLSFKSTDSSKVNYLVKALRGKEAHMSENLLDVMSEKDVLAEKMSATPEQKTERTSVSASERMDRTDVGFSPKTVQPMRGAEVGKTDSEQQGKP